MRAYTSPGSGKAAQPSVKKKSNSVPISTGRSSSSSQRKFGWKFYVLVLLALVIVGTFTVLRTVVHFFGVHDEDVISIAEIQSYTNIEALPFNAELSPSQAREEEEQLGLKREKIPRIIHQTWKSEVLPEKWETVRNECMAMLPDFEFKLWSDADSREFIATEYPAFLNTWDSYPYTIQRADAIRYFVLHKYGGIYMDLDIGCRAHPGPLLHFESILPITKPVGVSNDLMFSAPKTPFMDLVINSLETFNHEWLYMPYPTVMFSTGPMFISAIYSMWHRILQRGVGIDASQRHIYQRVRILPKSLYGKNILPEDAPHSFFWHYYGSSWHAGDAGFIGFLGKYGYRILLLGSTLVVLGFFYLLWTKRQQLRSPRYRKISLDPFEDLAISPPVTLDNSKQHLSLDDEHSSFLKSPISHITNLFKHSEAVVTKGRYMPLAAVSSRQQIRQRSNTLNSNENTSPQPIQSSMLPASPGTAPPRRKPRVHPIATRPHSRQRSRDIERGSPIYQAQMSPGETERQTSWTWPDSATAATCPTPGLVTGSSAGDARFQSSICAEPEAITPPPFNHTLPSMTFTEPSDDMPSGYSETIFTRPSYSRQSSSSKAEDSYSPSSMSSTSPRTRPRPLQRPSIRPLSSSNGSEAGRSFTGRMNRTRKVNASPQDVEDEVEGVQTSSFRTRKSSNTTTDGDVSASEMMDMLTELEPVASNTAARTGISTPGERAKDSYFMRKRSLSSEGERFPG